MCNFIALAIKNKNKLVCWFTITFNLCILKSVLHSRMMCLDKDRKKPSHARSYKARDYSTGGSVKNNQEVELGRKSKACQIREAGGPCNIFN